MSDNKMTIGFDIERQHSWRHIKAIFWCLLKGKVRLEFAAGEIQFNGERDPVILSRNEADVVKSMQTERAATIELLIEAIDEAVDLLGSSKEPALQLITSNLKDAKESLCQKPRVLH